MKRFLILSTVLGLMVGPVATGAARFSRRITAAVFVVLASLGTVVTPLAEAQTNDPQAPAGYPVLSPKTSTVLESDGEVVLTLSMSRDRPARVGYNTVDATAKAPGDYSAVRGDVVLTDGNTSKIKVPIVDDGFAEDEETFKVYAGEEYSCASRCALAIVRIIDDDGVVDTATPAAGTGAPSEVGPAAPAAGSSTITPAGGQFSDSAMGASAPTSGVPAARAAATTTTTAAAPASPGEVALPSGERRSGPGFELASEGVPEPAPQRRRGPNASASGLAIGSGIACLGVGALAVVRRRRRSSTTQA